MTRDTAIAERLHDAADRIPVDTADLRDLLDPGRRTVDVVRRRSTRRPALAAAVLAAAAAALVVTVVVRHTGDGPVATGPAGPTAADDVAPHVADPPDWFGEPRSGLREDEARTGRWVSTVIGRVTGDDVDQPIVVTAFDGHYRWLDDAVPVTIDGTPLRSRRVGAWRALATDGTPTVMVSGNADEGRLARVLDAVEVDDGRSREFSLRLESLPPGYTEVVAPRELGPDVAERRTLASASGDTAIDNMSDWTDPLLYAAQSGSDLTVADVGGTTGWIGRSELTPHGPLEFLVWSPRPGLVLAITTDDPARPHADLVDLALATSTLPTPDWDTTYD